MKQNDEIVSGKITGLPTSLFNKKRAGLPIDTSFGEGGSTATLGGENGTCSTIKSRYHAGCYYSQAVGAVSSRLNLLDENGHLVKSYNGSGYVDLSSRLNTTVQLAEDANGNVLCYGVHTSNGERTVHLYRFKADGQSDDSFGDGGVVHLNAVFPEAVLNVAGLVVSDSGYVLRVFNLSEGVWRVSYLVAYDQQGKLNQAFGKLGKIRIGDIVGAGGGEDLSWVYIRSGAGFGTYVISFYRIRDNETLEACLVGLDSSGSIAKDFGDQGFVTFQGNMLFDRLVADDASERLTLGGVDFEWGRPNLARLDYQGGFDPAFNRGIPVRFDATPVGAWNCIAANSEGQVLAISSIGDLRGTVAVCYTASGLLDPRFAESGWAFLDPDRDVSSAPSVFDKRRVLLSGSGWSNKLVYQAEILALKMPAPTD